MAKYTKRRDKRGYEWKSAYREKEALMLERGYPEVSPHDFYRELFPTGSLQQEPGDGKGNIIATQIRPSGKGRTRQWVIDDSLKMLDKVIGDRFGLIPPISFYGKSHTKENAHELFAVVVDVDYVGKQQLKNLLKQFGNGVQLRPTYLVSSGKGVHLYYFLQEPVQLYRNREEVLAELKEAFIRRLWNDTSSIRPDSPDITGIYQGFRCVGSQSKLGADFPVKAYKLSENRYTLEDIKASIPSCKVDLAPLYEKPRRRSTVTLEEAKELYPEWYEKRIVQGEPKQKSKKQGGTWVCNEALYEWWKRKITEEVKAGGRYFSIMALCSYGLKCGISEQKIRRDAYAFLDHLESLTEDEDNHFSRADVKDALRALKGDRKRLSTIASREWIEDNTKVTIPANKRNYRKQEAHFNLELESSKSRLIEFGRFAETNRLSRGIGKPEAFDFLGFTFYCGKTRKGTFALKLQTSRKKFERKLKEYKLWIYDNRNRPVREIIKELNVKLVGHYRYYGVTWNYRRLCAFLHRVQQFLFKAVNRRGCRRAYTWGGFWEMLKCYPLAKPKTYYCLY